MFLIFSEENEKWFQSIHPHLKTPKWMIEADERREKQSADDGDDFLASVQKTPTVRPRKSVCTASERVDLKRTKLVFDDEIIEDEVDKMLREHNERILKQQHEQATNKKPASIPPVTTETAAPPVKKPNKRVSCLPLLAAAKKNSKFRLISPQEDKQSLISELDEEQPVGDTCKTTPKTTEEKIRGGSRKVPVPVKIVSAEKGKAGPDNLVKMEKGTAAVKTDKAPVKVDRGVPCKAEKENTKPAATKKPPPTGAAAVKKPPPTALKNKVPRRSVLPSKPPLATSRVAGPIKKPPAAPTTGTRPAPSTTRPQAPPSRRVSSAPPTRPPFRGGSAPPVRPSSARLGRPGSGVRPAGPPPAKQTTRGTVTKTAAPQANKTGTSSRTVGSTSAVQKSTKSKTATKPGTQETKGKSVVTKPDKSQPTTNNTKRQITTRQGSEAVMRPVRPTKTLRESQAFSVNSRTMAIINEAPPQSLVRAKPRHSIETPSPIRSFSRYDEKNPEAVAIDEDQYETVGIDNNEDHYDNNDDEDDDFDPYLDEMLRAHNNKVLARERARHRIPGNQGGGGEGS